MLNRLYFDNYRCMVNFECRLGPKQLLLGPNGGGKTTLFQALATLRDFCAHGAPAEDLFLGATTTRWQSAPIQTFELDINGNGGNDRFRLVVDSHGQPVTKPRVVQEDVSFDGKPTFRFANGEVHLFNDKHENKVKYPFDWYRSALATIADRPENTKLNWFKRWLGNVLYISPDPHQMKPVAEREEFAPKTNLSNFASWYRFLRLARDDHELLEELREVIPGFSNLLLEPVGMGNYLLTVESKANGDSGAERHYRLGFSEISDGQRVLIGLYVIFHFALRTGALILFDEPDNFIALGEIQPWLEKVLERVDSEDSQAQIVIASHHPELLNRLAMTGGIVLDRPGGRQARAQRFEDPDETGLSPAELVARGWVDG